MTLVLLIGDERKEERAAGRGKDDAVGYDETTGHAISGRAHTGMQDITVDRDTLPQVYHIR